MLSPKTIRVTNVVIGMGEIGKPIYQMLSKGSKTIGYDKNQKLNKKYLFYNDYLTEFLHICIPFNKGLRKQIEWFKWQFKPRTIVIHSTVPPDFTIKLQIKHPFNLFIYSPVRGVHKRMIKDLKRYTKFYAVEPAFDKHLKPFKKMMRKSGFKLKQMSNTTTLELAKILIDTSYYGYLISYAQISQLIINKFSKDQKISFKEVWSFSDDIQKFLGNRPKFYAGNIGGHCVLQNLSLINDTNLNKIIKINDFFNAELKNAKSNLG